MDSRFLALLKGWREGVGVDGEAELALCQSGNMLLVKLRWNFGYQPGVMTSADVSQCDLYSDAIAFEIGKRRGIETREMVGR